MSRRSREQEEPGTASREQGAGRRRSREHGAVSVEQGTARISDLDAGPDKSAADSRVDQVLLLELARQPRLDPHRRRQLDCRRFSLRSRVGQDL